VQLQTSCTYGCLQSPPPLATSCGTVMVATCADGNDGDPLPRDTHTVGRRRPKASKEAAAQTGQGLSKAVQVCLSYFWTPVTHPPPLPPLHAPPHTHTCAPTPWPQSKQKDRGHTRTSSRRNTTTCLMHQQCPCMLAPTLLQHCCSTAPTLLQHCANTPTTLLQHTHAGQDMHNSLYRALPKALSATLWAGMPVECTETCGTYAANLWH
jgi:hypothetical protein